MLQEPYMKHISGYESVIVCFATTPNHGKLIMKQSANMKKFSFDETSSISKVGTLSLEDVRNAGGPIDYSLMRSQRAKRVEKEKPDSKGEVISKMDLKARKRSLNRKASKTIMEGRRAHDHALEEINVAVSTHIHSLERTEHELDKSIQQTQHSLHHPTR